jgi:hypothetical protein
MREGDPALKHRDERTIRLIPDVAESIPKSRREFAHDRADCDRVSHNKLLQNKFRLRAESRADDRAEGFFVAARPAVAPYQLETSAKVFSF